jgi:hypothetical protein
MPLFNPSSGSGALTSLGSLAGTGASGVIDFTSIPSSFKDLIIVASGRTSAAAIASNVAMNVNGLSTAIYDEQRDIAIAGSSSGDSSPGATSLPSVLSMVGASATAGFSSGGVIQIIDYAGTALNKRVYASQSTLQNATSGACAAINLTGQIRLTSAINRVTFTLASGNFTTDTRYYLYGRG